MKGKKNRKILAQVSPLKNLHCKTSLDDFKIRFDVLNNDISCFISQKINYKYLIMNNSIQKSSHHHLPTIQQYQYLHYPHHIHLFKSKQTRNQSLDLIKQSSNTILSKIQEKGIRCHWEQTQTKTQERTQTQNHQENQNLWNAFENSFDKSHASTNDYNCVQSISLYWQTPKTLTQSSNQFSIIPELICVDWRTTLMIRNIPNKYTINQLALQIDTDHANTYDFLYLPCDLKNQCNVGYGFINFINTQFLYSFYCQFQQYIWKRYRSQKICSLTYARLQGLTQLIQHFQNSKVLNQKEKKYRPIIKYDEIQKMVLQQQSR